MGCGAEVGVLWLGAGGGVGQARVGWRTLTLRSVKGEPSPSAGTVGHRRSASEAVDPIGAVGSPLTGGEARPDSSTAAFPRTVPRHRTS